MTPTLRRAPLLPALLLALAGLAGCGTFGALNNAARNLDAYELRPLPPQTQGDVRVGGRWSSSPSPRSPAPSAASGS